MLKAHTRKIGNVTEFLLKDAPEAVIMAADVFVENGNLVVLDTKSDTRIEELELPGPVKAYRDSESEVVEWEDGETKHLPFYELALNPIVDSRSVRRVLQSFGGGVDNIRHSMMQMAKVHILDEEMKLDDEIMLDMDWGIRVYKVFCRVIPADETPREDEEFEDDSGLTYILEGHGGLVGCVAYHCAAMIVGVNE